MQKKEDLTIIKSNFFDTFYLYVSESRDKHFQDYSSISNNGIFYKYFIDNENHLIGDFFRGFRLKTEREIPGYEAIVMDYFERHSSQFTSSKILEMEEELELFWEKYVKEIPEYLKFTTSLKDERILDHITLSLKTTVNLEIKKNQIVFENYYHKIHKSIFKRIVIIFTPIGALVGFLNAISDFIYKISHVVMSFFNDIISN